jgi:hypothetical protein
MGSFAAPKRFRQLIHKSRGAVTRSPCSLHAFSASKRFCDEERRPRRSRATRRCKSCAKTNCPVLAPATAHSLKRSSETGATTSLAQTARERETVRSTLREMRSSFAGCAPMILRCQQITGARGSAESSAHCRATSGRNTPYHTACPTPVDVLATKFASPA